MQITQKDPFISHARAVEAGRQAVLSGQARGFTVHMTRRRNPDRSEDIGWTVALKHSKGLKEKGACVSRSRSVVSPMRGTINDRRGHLATRTWEVGN